MSIKKFINRLVVLVWLVLFHNEVIVIDGKTYTSELRIFPGSIFFNISFAEFIDEAFEYLELFWWDCITSSGIDIYSAPWGDHKRTKHQAMSDHHFSWRFEKLLVPDKVHYYIYDGIKYSFTVKEYGLFTDNHGSPSVQVEVLMHEGSEIRYTTLLSVYSCVHEIVRHDPFRIYLMPPD